MFEFFRKKKSSAYEKSYRSGHVSCAIDENDLNKYTIDFQSSLYEDDLPEVEQIVDEILLEMNKNGVDFGVAMQVPSLLHKKLTSYFDWYLAKTAAKTVPYLTYDGDDQSDDGNHKGEN